MKLRPKYLGLYAEYMAILTYKILGYELISHRKKIESIEVDIIVRRKNTIVFIEVKARTNNFDDILLKRKQQLRLSNALDVFITQNTKYINTAARMDLVIFHPYSMPNIVYNITIDFVTY